MSVFNKVISHSEKVTGLSVKEIRAYTPEQFRKHIENRHNTKLSFVSEFPVIGRGKVLRDDFVSRDVLDAEIDEILSGASPRLRVIM